MALHEAPWPDVPVSSHVPGLTGEFIAACCSILFGLASPTPLMAQDISDVEIGAGLGAIVDSELPKTTPTAWIVSVARPLNDFLMLVGEVSGQATQSVYNTSDMYVFTEPCTGSSVTPGEGPCRLDGTMLLTRARRGNQDVDVQVVLVGVRAARRLWRLEPFAQLLVGAARVRWQVVLEGLPPDAVPVESPDEGEDSRSTRHHSPGIQFGAGVDLPIGRRLTARLALEGRRLVNEPRFTSQARGSAQLVLALGRQHPSNPTSPRLEASTPSHTPSSP